MKVGDVIKTRDGNIFGTIVGKEYISSANGIDGSAIQLLQVMTVDKTEWYLKEHLEVINKK